MSNPSLEAVLPLTLRDVDRASILLRSLDKYFPSLDRVLVIVPDDEHWVMQEALRRHPRCDVVRETTVVPEIQLWRRLGPYLPGVFPPLRGWYLQQLIKLAAAEHLKSDFFLVLDADVVCVRPTLAEDLVVDGRALSSRYASDVHTQWYVDSARSLGMARSTWTHSVTPAVLSRAAVQALAGYLDGRSSVGQRTLLALLPSRIRRTLRAWRLYLLFNLPWTEYATYFTFLENTGQYERYHQAVGRERVAAIHRSVWKEADFEAWDPAIVFDNDDGYSFVVIQSNSRIPVIDVWEKLRPFLL